MLLISGALYRPTSESGVKHYSAEDTMFLLSKDCGVPLDQHDLLDVFERHALIERAIADRDGDIQYKKAHLDALRKLGGAK